MGEGRGKKGDSYESKAGLSQRSLEEERSRHLSADSQEKRVRVEERIQMNKHHHLGSTNDTTVAARKRPHILVDIL